MEGVQDILSFQSKLNYYFLQRIGKKKDIMLDSTDPHPKLKITRKWVRGTFYNGTIFRARAKSNSLAAGQKIASLSRFPGWYMRSFSFSRQPGNLP